MPTRAYFPDDEGAGPRKKERTRRTSDGPWNVGANYLIRTVTMIDTGRLVDVGPQELVLEEAAWIADTGRDRKSVV